MAAVVLIEAVFEQLLDRLDAVVLPQLTDEHPVDPVLGIDDYVLNVLVVRIVLLGFLQMSVVALAQLVDARLQVLDSASV